MRPQQYDILVVDDDAEDRMMMSEAFSQLDCQHRVTMYDSSGAFHLELPGLRELNPLPLLTVLDYNLPGADGSLLLLQLKTDPVLCAIPVVMYTNGMSRSQEQDCQVKGAIKCYVKGATYEDVVSFCKQVCDLGFSNSILPEEQDR